MLNDQFIPWRVGSGFPRSNVRIPVHHHQRSIHAKFQVDTIILSGNPVYTPICFDAVIVVVKVRADFSYRREPDLVGRILNPY